MTYNSIRGFTRAVLLAFIVTLLALSIGCASAEEGTALVQVVRSNIKRVIRANDGWVNTANTFGDEYFPVDLHSFTDTIAVTATTKDNAALSIQVAITAHVKPDDASIISYVRKLGLDGKERHERRNGILWGQLNTSTKNAVSKYDAYDLLANQEAVRKAIVDELTPVLDHQLYLEIESVQIIGRPDFSDNRIEQAASAVVANQKAKEAAEADLARAKVEAEKKQVEAQTFKDPALLQIKLLELNLDIARAKADGIAKHNGSLTLIEGNLPSVQVKAGQ